MEGAFAALADESVVVVDSASCVGCHVTFVEDRHWLEPGWFPPIHRFTLAGLSFFCGEGVATLVVGRQEGLILLGNVTLVVVSLVGVTWLVALFVFVRRWWQKLGIVLLHPRRFLLLIVREAIFI